MDWLDSADPALMRRLLDCRRTAAALPGPTDTQEILAKVRSSAVSILQNKESVHFVIIQSEEL